MQWSLSCKADNYPASPEIPALYSTIKFIKTFQTTLRSSSPEPDRGFAVPFLEVPLKYCACLRPSHALYIPRAKHHVLFPFLASFEVIRPSPNFVKFFVTLRCLDDSTSPNL